MERYDSYKDSGIEWIGEIPSGWKNVKIKFLGKVSSGDSLESSLIDKNEGKYPVYGGNGVMGYYSEYNFNKPILVIGRVGEKCGNVHYSEKEIYVNDNSLVYEQYSEKMNLWYVYHSLVQRDLNQLRNKNTQPLITGTIVKDETIPFPPIKEQQQIVQFLDTKTSLIDSLMEKTQRKIELLKEKRTSLINTVVTKGLNPNVEMKDSGVEWIGEIPSGWNLNKVGNNTYVKGRIGWKGLRSEDFIEKGPFLITGTDFNKDGTINWDKMYHVSQDRYDEDPFIQLQDNDVLITKDGTIGKVVFVGNLKGQTCLNSGIFLTRPTNDEYISKFFYWVLKSMVFSVFVDYNSGGSTIQHLYQNVFVNFKIPLPPIKEQKQIVEYLDEQTNLIDKTILTEQKRVDILKEYRQSLISEVVTGKIKVSKDE